MSLSIAVIVLIACYRDVKAQTQDEREFVQEPASLHTYRHLDADNSYVDTENQVYHQTTSTSTPLKVARDDTPFSSPLTQTANGKAIAFTQGSSGFINNLATTSETFNLNRIGNLDSAASSFNGFGGGNPNAGFSFPSGAPSFANGGTSSPFGGSSSFGGGFFNSGSGGGGGGGYHGGNSGGGDGYGGGGGSSEGGYNHLQPVIHKSVYVHVAPPEEEVPKQKVILPKIPPKKNYQIVFIKAPTPPPPSAPVIPQFPPQSDKTLIYVLHPKPEEAPPIHVPPPPQNEPVKPEVYFIKYKTKKEQEEGDGYHRRYGRDGIEEENEDESLDATDSSARSVPQESEVPSNQYDEQSDTSGESSNIIRIYTTERGKNAH